MWTSRKWGKSPADLGASWIHGAKGNPLSSLAKEARAELLPSDYLSHPTFYDSVGARLGKADVDELNSLSKAFQDSLEWRILARRLTFQDDLPLQAVLNDFLVERQIGPEETRLAGYAVRLLALQFGADAKDLSLYKLNEGETFSGGDALFPNGYSQLPAYLAEGLDIRFGEVVERISYSEGGVSVFTKKNTYTADRAVVTLPLGVLKKGDIAFEPALPEDKRDAISKIEVGLLNKLYLRFPKVFWRRSESIGYLSDPLGRWPGWINFHAYTNEPVLLALNGGSFAHEVEGWTDEKTVADSLRVLKTIYGEATLEPTNYQLTRWASDPFAYGSYSYPTVGQGDARAVLAKPLQNVLFFAGEATSEEYPWTVHGAYLSGLREAERIAKL